MSLAVDHLVVCVEDLTAAATSFRTGFGLESVEGGRHRGHGTANRIVPLGDSYMELLAVVDPGEASHSGFGLWAAEKAPPPARVDAVCLRTDDIGEVAARLDLVPMTMSRRRPDGVELAWRLAGLEQATSEALPFFIEWLVPEAQHPGRLPISHRAGTARIVSVTMSGEVGRLRLWAEGAVGVEIVAGKPGITAALVTDAGTVSI